MTSVIPTLALHISHRCFCLHGTCISLYLGIFIFKDIGVVSKVTRLRTGRFGARFPTGVEMFLSKTSGDQADYFFNEYRISLLEWKRPASTLDHSSPPILRFETGGAIYLRPPFAFLKWTETNLPHLYLPLRLLKYPPRKMTIFAGKIFLRTLIRQNFRRTCISHISVQK